MHVVGNTAVVVAICFKARTPCRQSAAGVTGASTQLSTVCFRLFEAGCGCEKTTRFAACSKVRIVERQELVSLIRPLCYRKGRRHQHYRVTIYLQNHLQSPSFINIAIADHNALTIHLHSRRHDISSSPPATKYRQHNRRQPPFARDDLSSLKHITPLRKGRYLISDVFFM